MQHVTEIKSQADADYDYVASLYNLLAKKETLHEVCGFKRSIEDAVGTFFYSIGDDFLYINPFVDVFLNGETLEEDFYVNVTLCSASGELISCHYITLPYNSIESSAEYYEREVVNILTLIKHVRG